MRWITEAANCISQCAHTTDIHQSGGPNAVLLTRTPSTKTRSSSEFSAGLGISPGKIKNQELREFQQLLEQNVLTEEEFTEQKGMVLSSLRKLAH